MILDLNWCIYELHPSMQSSPLQKYFIIILHFQNFAPALFLYIPFGDEEQIIRWSIYRNNIDLFPSFMLSLSVFLRIQIHNNSLHKLFL